MNNKGSLASSNEGSNPMMLSNMALQGAFKRIECISMSHSEGSTWNDDNGGGFEDSHHQDGP